MVARLAARRSLALCALVTFGCRPAATGVPWDAGSDNRADPGEDAPAAGGDRGGAAGCWSASVRLGDPTPRGRASHEVALAAGEDGHVYAAWMDEKYPGLPGLGWLRLAASSDGGERFTTHEAPRHSPAADWMADPALAVDSLGRVHMTWMEMRLALGDLHGYYAVSDDHGKSFSIPQRFDSRSDLVGPDRPWIGASGNGTLYVVWSSGTKRDQMILLARRGVDEAEWTETVLREEAADRTTTAPSLAVDGERLVAGWAEVVGGEPGYVVLESMDGTEFSQPRPVEPLASAAEWGFDSHPWVATGASGPVLVAYTSQPAVVTVARSAGGAPFDASRVAPAAGDVVQWLPRAHVSADGALHVAWIQGDWRLWQAAYARSIDGGRTFLPAEIVSDEPFAHPIDPARATSTDLHPIGDVNDVVATGSFVYFGWGDRRTGDFEARLARRPRTCP